MTFQAVRRYFEEPIETALSGFSIPIRYENQLVPDGDATSEYALVRQFWDNRRDCYRLRP